MWTASHLLERGARVVLLEADVWDMARAAQRRLLRDAVVEPALATGPVRRRAGSGRVRGVVGQRAAIGAWRRRRAGRVVPPGRLRGDFDQRGQDAVIAGTWRPPPRWRRARSSRSTPRRRGRARLAARPPRPARPDDATLQPARLALGLRAADRARGGVYECSRVRSLRADPAASTPRRVMRACGRGGCSPSSPRPGVQTPPVAPRGDLVDIVLTEPVPDVIESTGWTGGESITTGDAPVLLPNHTRRSILFGWGGGELAMGARFDATRRIPGRSRRSGAISSTTSRRSRAGRSRTPGAARSTSRPATCRRSARSTTVRCTTCSGSPGTASHVDLAGRVLAGLASG